MLFYMPCRCCFRPYNLKGYGVFKGKEIASANHDGLELGKFKYNITGRNLSGLCDFLHMEGKFVENVSVVNGWKVWLFVEGTSTSDILIYDYFVREK